MIAQADGRPRGRLRGVVGVPDLAGWLPVLGLALLAIVIRAPGIASGSLWLDELAQVFVARSPLPAFLEGVRGHLAAAPLDYLGTKLALATVGRVIPNITFAAHVWPLICGVATVVATWGLTLELTGRRRAAMAAGLMTALSGFLVFYSQEARPYAMATLMGVVSIWVFARATRLDRRRDWLVVGVVAVLSVYTHYFLGLVLAAEGVALVMVRLVRLVRMARGQDGLSLASLRPIAVFVLIGLVTLVAFIPWYLFATENQLANPVGYPPVEDLSPERLARLLASLLAAVPRGGVPTGDLWPDWLLTAAVVALACVGALGVVRRRPEPGLALVGFTVSLIPVVWWFDTRSQYVISERQFIFMIPMVYLLAGAGIDGALTRIGRLLRDRGVAHRLIARGVPIVLVATLVLASVAPLERVYAGTFRPKEDWRSASALVAKAICPDGHVYTNVTADFYYGVTLYAPQLTPRIVYLRLDPPGEYLLDSIKRYPITHHDVIVILVPSVGVFVPGRGGIGNIAAAMQGKGFSSVSFTDDRIRVLYVPGGCTR